MSTRVLDLALIDEGAVALNGVIGLPLEGVDRKANPIRAGRIRINLKAAGVQAGGAGTRINFGLDPGNAELGYGKPLAPSDGVE